MKKISSLIFLATFVATLAVASTATISAPIDFVKDMKIITANGIAIEYSAGFDGESNMILATYPYGSTDPQEVVVFSDDQGKTARGWKGQMRNARWANSMIVSAIYDDQEDLDKIDL